MHTQSTQIFTVGDELDMVESGSSVAGLKEGQELTRAQMMDALMLPSGNDSAYVVAANVGRILLNDPAADSDTAVLAFVAEMNRFATELGCQSTHFENPDGMTSEGHKTTARDMLKIACKANTFTEIKNSVSKPAVNVEISGKSYYWKNTNEMLRQGPYHFTYITGMKTGYTTPAGYCLVASANRIGEEVIVVVLGGRSSEERFADVYRLLNEAYAYHDNEN
jgi:D-alanyl-D-alanine carboxypeptidase (penicillin-binding protein 5/6)